MPPNPAAGAGSPALPAPGSNDPDAVGTVCKLSLPINCTTINTMDTNTTPETPAPVTPEAVEPTGSATYCPEDNKLRLYIGRVPKPEYLKLREEGWKALHKQREAGGGDFVATWTPARRDTALRYSGGVIEDEDMSPAERAADRAERFQGYLEKRLNEAGTLADRFDSGPQVHGAQDYSRAVRSADRHDRIAGKAVDAWEKAEYWQRRTAGVIAHALYKVSPGLRMGRISELESNLRRQHLCPEWRQHYELRLAYERQMLEAAGGVAETLAEIVPGGLFGGRLIVRVYKSNETGRAKSVEVLGPKVQGWTYRAKNVPGTEFALHSFDLQRYDQGAYTPPTPETLAQLEAFKAAKSEGKAPTVPLVNPTLEDAQRLQDLWNERAKAGHDESVKRRGYASDEFKPGSVVVMTQAAYSARSGSDNSPCSTGLILKGGERARRGRHSFEALACKVRYASPASYSWHAADRVVLISDKPQKPLPASTWEAVAEPVTA